MNTLELNLISETSLTTEWEANRAFMRRRFISHILTRTIMQKQNDILLNYLKKLETSHKLNSGLDFSAKDKNYTESA